MPTGNLSLPTEADVKFGVQYGANGTEYTGTYDATTGMPTVTDVYCTNYSPSEVDKIQIRASISNSPTNVICIINGVSKIMTVSAGSTYATESVSAGYFGVSTNQTITVVATNAIGGIATNGSTPITISEYVSDNYYSKERNVELSTLKYVEDSFDADWSNITIVKAFKNAYEATLPVVCVELDSVFSIPDEIGTTDLRNTFGISIDIFAKSSGQLIDLSAYLLNKLKTGWVYYDFTQPSGGNSKTLDVVADGRVKLVEVVSNTKILFGEQVEKQDRYRRNITILVSKG